MNQKRKKYQYLLYAILLCCLTSCQKHSGTPEQNAMEKPAVHYQIGICQISTDLYDESLTQGFQKSLEESLNPAQITILTGNADSADTLALQCQEMDQSGSDLLFLANTGTAIPIDTGGLQTPIMTTPCCDVTGKAVQTLLNLLPDINQLGILYHSADPAAAAKTKQMTRYLKQNKITFQKYPAIDAASFCSGANDICDQCDAAYIPSDKLSIGQAEKTGDIFLPAGIPLITDHAAFHDISIATVTPDYYNLGCRLGELAADALQNGTAPDSTGINAADFIKADYNRQLCEDLDISIPD